MRPSVAHMGPGWPTIPLSVDGYFPCVSPQVLCEGATASSCLFGVHSCCQKAANSPLGSTSPVSIVSATGTPLSPSIGGSQTVPAT
jgi:hypothetical protein